MRYVVADTERLPFADAAFDMVVCILTLEFIAHPPTAVAELRRVLKPGGHLVVGVLGRWSPWNLWRRLRGAMGHPLWQRAHFFRITDITNLLRDAGVQDVHHVSTIFLPPMPAHLHTTLYRLVDACGRWCCPWAGAFIAVSARKSEQVR